MKNKEISMEVINTIKNRRSIRKFKDVAIQKAQITEILNCGRLAPSAKNRQPWRFVVITNKKKINDIANIMIENFSKENEEYAAGVLKTISTVLPTANIIKQSPVVIFVFKKADEDWSTGDNLSVGACIENMCLAACSLGLGALWMRDIFYSLDKLTDYIKWNNKEYSLNSALCIGVPDEKPSPKTKNKLKDITTWIN